MKNEEKIFTNYFTTHTKPNDKTVASKTYSFIENIKENEWENFIKKTNKSHFMEAYCWGEVQKNKKYTPHYVGLKKDNTLVGVALILEKKLLKRIKYFYSPRGFITDYSNLELLEVFLDYLKKYTKKEKAIFLKLNPDIYYHILDNNGNIKERPQNGIEILKLFQKSGLKHKGFNKNFENNEPRYTFRLSLNKPWKDIFNSFHSTTKKILNRNNQYNLNIYKGEINDLKDFYTIMLETAKRKNIIPFKLDYYKKFYQVLNEHNMSDLYIVKANTNELQNIIENKINTINLEIKKNKKEQMILDLEKQKNKLLKLKEETKSITEPNIILSAIITVKYQDKVWMVHGGHNTILRGLFANYLICEQIIKDAYNEGYEKIDFFGTIGDLKETNPIYGIHSFKKHFGGDYIEFIGEFDYIANKPLYFIYIKLIPIYRKIRRKILKTNKNI